MNPTEHEAAGGEPSAAESAAERFFDDILTPLAEVVGARGARLLADGAGAPPAGSYFSSPKRTRMEPADFDLDLESGERFVDALMALWREEGITELEICRDDLIALIEAFAEEARNSQGSADVSPFVYAMY